MPAEAPILNNVFFEDRQPAGSDSRAELLAGLRLPQKQINPKFFYDIKGSRLFDRITQLDEYYLTRSEIEILTTHAAELALCCGSNCVLIEPGSGSSEKIRLLLDDMQPAAYVPLDISAEFLYASALELGREFPWLQVHAICADFTDHWQDLTRLPKGRRVIFYPGSTIGNMHPDRAKGLLSELRQWIGDDGGVLIGVDLHKSAQRLNAAYNDAQGVTAEFNLNVLNSINKLADANFRKERFFHRAFYNRDLKRIEMHLVSKELQTVKVNGSAIVFDKGETLHTENSYKYTLESFTELSLSGGFAVEQSWFDKEGLFSFHYLTVANC